jgi:hypothetical protein
MLTACLIVIGVLFTVGAVVAVATYILGDSAGLEVDIACHECESCKRSAGATGRLSIARPWVSSRRRGYGSTRAARSVALSAKSTQPHPRLIAIRELNPRPFKSSTKLYSCFFATSQQSIRCFKPFHSRYRHICSAG